MKALFCESCGDIIAPLQEAMTPRYCRCGRHAVWWRDPARGLISVHDKYRHYHTEPSEGGGTISRPTPPACYILGFTNAWLMFPEKLTREDYEQIIEAHDDYYLFKRLRSVAIRIRPGESSDSKYENSLPVQFDSARAERMAGMLSEEAIDARSTEATSGTAPA